MLHTANDGGEDSNIQKVSGRPGIFHRQLLRHSKQSQESLVQDVRLSTAGCALSLRTA